jgi:hypothetical protein
VGGDGQVSQVCCKVCLDNKGQVKLLVAKIAYRSTLGRRIP